METEKKNTLIGNTTTVVTSISLAFSGLILGILASWGLHLPIDQTSLAGVIGTIIMFIFSLVNAKYHCNFFDNDDVLNVDVSGLTEGQIESIQNFVDNASQLNQHNNINIAGREYTSLNGHETFDNDAPTVLNDEYLVSDDDGC